MDGLQSLLDLINAQQQQEGLDSKPLSLPVDMIVSLTSPFKKLNDIVTPQVAERLVLGIKDTIFNRLNTIEDRDLKDIDKDLINRTLRDMKEFLQLYYSQDDANKMIDTTQLLMALRFLKTPFMEKRIKGLNEIKNVVEKVSQKQGFTPKKSTYDQSHYHPIRMQYSSGSWANSSYYPNQSYHYNSTTWIDANYLIEWINNSQLLDILLNPENTHAEVIKRTPTILRFLAQNKSLSNEMLDKLWACQQGGKHEAIVNAVLQVVTQVASVLSLDQLNMLYSRIKTTPHDQCDQSFIKFLKDFSKNAILAANREFQKERQNLKNVHSPRVQVKKKPSKKDVLKFNEQEDENPTKWGAGSGETEDTTQPEEPSNSSASKINHPDLVHANDDNLMNDNSNNDSSSDYNNANQQNTRFDYEDETQLMFDLCIDIQNKTINEEIIKYFANDEEPIDDESIPQPLQKVKLRSLILSKNSFGLSYLWNIIQDQAHQISPQLARQARLAIQEILGQDQCKDFRLFMLFKALNNGQKFKSVTLSFDLAKFILALQAPENVYIPTSSNSHKDYHPLLTKLNSYINVIETTLNQIQKYVMIVNNYTQNSSTKTDNNPKDVVFLSKFSHQQTIESLFDFIYFCVTRARHQHHIKLGEEYIIRLWGIMIKNGNFEYDAEFFLNWLQRSHSISSYTKVPLCDDDEKQFMFHKILCQPQYTENPQFSMIFFKCFQAFFKEINYQRRNLEIQSHSQYHQSKKQEPRQQQISVLSFDDLIGLDSLWVITFHATDDAVRNAAIKLLVDLHLRVSNQKSRSVISYRESGNKNKINQQDIWITFIERCMNEIQSCYEKLRNNQNHDNEQIKRKVSTSLKALSKFLDGHLAAQVSKGVDYFAKYKTASQNPVMLEIQPDGITKTVHLPYTCTYGNVKIAVQKSLNVQSTDQFVVLNKRGRPLSTDDAQTLKAYNWTTLYVHRIQQKRNLLKELEQLDTEAQLEKIEKEKAQNQQIEKLNTCKQKARKEQQKKITWGNYRDQEEQQEEQQAGGINSKSSKHPKYIISKHPEYIDILVGLLQVGEGLQFVKPAWDLLMKLPVSRKLALQLRDFKGADGQPFDLNQILPRSSIHKMLYSLQIVKELLDATQESQVIADIRKQSVSQESKDSSLQTMNWGMQFISNGGVQHLIQAIKAQNVQKIESSLQIKYFAILLTLFQKFSEMNIQESSSLISANKVEIVHKILALFSAVSEYTIQKEQKSIEQADKQAKMLGGHKMQKVPNTGTQKRRKKKRMVSKSKGMGDSDQDQKQSTTRQVKQTSAQKWGMADDDQDIDDGFQRDDDPLVIQSNEEAQIFSSSMKFLFYNSSEIDRIQQIKLVGQIISTIYHFDRLEQLLSSSLLRSVNYKIRDEIANIFKSLFNIDSNQEHESEISQLIPDAVPLKQRVLNILVDKLLPQSFEFQDTCEAFFELFSCIFIELRSEEVNKIFKFDSRKAMNGYKSQGNLSNLENFLIYISNLVLQKQTSQFSQNDCDCLLIGLFNLINAILKQNPKLKLQKCMQGTKGHLNGLLNYIVTKCLFEFPSKKSQIESKDSLFAPPPKCKSQESRDAAFDLVLTLVQGNKNGLMSTILTLLQYHRNNSWRSQKKTDWSIITFQSEKSSTGFVGLKNLGCICYLNSIMQQLFMISSFRDDILACPDNQRIGKQVKDEDNVLLQIQLLFGALKMSEKMYFNPQGFCHAFKDWEGQPINVIQQMDADQFFSMLMDKLEGLVKGTHVQKTVTENFGGKFANEIICKDCPHFSERQEPFLAVSLQVKGKKTIMESLQAFVAGDRLQGDNAFYCDKCDKKVTALKRACIKRLPRTLVLPLKRFEYNFDTMQRNKCNDYCEFPDIIDMEPYTQEGLKRAERLKQREKQKRQRLAAGQDDEVADENGNKNKTEDDLLKKKYPDEYYLYKLVGVVIHIGTAESGHYYSLINDRMPNLRGKTGDDNWYEFNDTRVTPFDKSEIPNESFGGQQVWTSSFYSNYSVKSEKMKNAYLLLYERVNPWEPPQDEQQQKIKEAEKLEMKRKASQTQNADTKEEEGDLKLKREQSQVVKDGMLKYIFENMENENLRYWYNRFLFSQEYQNFVERLAFEWSSEFSVPSRVWTKNLDKLQKLIQDSNKTEGWQAKHNHNFYQRKAANYGEILQTQFHNEQVGLQRQNNQYNVFRLICSYFLVALIRSKDRRKVPIHLDILKSYVNRNERCAEWVLTQFSYPQIIKQFFFQCPEQDMRQLVGGLIVACMIKVYPKQKDRLQNYWKWYDFGRKDIVEKKEEVVSFSNGQSQKVEINQIVKFDSPSKEQTTILGNFINSMIGQLQNGKNYRFHLAEYFKVIAKFSNLGDEAIDYLLRCRVVGKFSDFFVNFNHNDQVQRIRDSSHLRTSKAATVVELGLPISVNSTTGLSSWDQYFQRKKQKNLAQRFGNLAYMWQTLSRCIRSTCFSSHQSKYMLRKIPDDILAKNKIQANADEIQDQEQQKAEIKMQQNQAKDTQTQQSQNPPQLKPTKYQLEQDEKQLFIQISTSSLRQIFQHGGKSGCTVGMRELGMLYAHISHGSEQNSKVVQKALIVGINERDYDGIQPYMVPVRYFLDIDDQLAEGRAKSFINSYLKLMKENKGYSKMTRSLISYLVKFARYNHYVQSFLQQNRQKVNWIFDWITNTIQNANYQYSGLNMSSFDKRNLKGDRIELRSIVQQSPQQEEKLRQMFKTEQWDDDGDMIDFVFSIGDQVDIIETTSSVQGVVTQVLDEMVQVHYQIYSHPKESWLRPDTNSIVPAKTKSSINSRVTLKYLENQMQIELDKKKKQELSSSESQNQQQQYKNDAYTSSEAGGGIASPSSSSDPRYDEGEEDDQQEGEDSDQYMH